MTDTDHPTAEHVSKIDQFVAVLHQGGEMRADIEAVIDWLPNACKPGVPVPRWTSYYVGDGVYGVRLSFYAADADAFEATIRALAHGAPMGAVVKKPSDDGKNMYGIRMFGGVQVRVLTGRENVCVRRKVGVETVEEPDPTVDVPMVTVERPIYEYDCAPVLVSGTEAG